MKLDLDLEPNLVKFEDELEVFQDNEDIASLDKLFDICLKSGSKAHKRLLAQAYLDIVSVFHYDHACDKLNEIKFAKAMIGWIDSAKKLQPESHKYQDYYASVYEIMADLSRSNPLESLNHLINAITAYRTHIQLVPDTPHSYSRLADCLYRQIKETKNFEQNQFDDLLELFQPAICNALPQLKGEFYQFDSHLLATFIRISYDILALPIDNNEVLHLKFIQCLNRLLDAQISLYPILNYHWASALYRYRDFLIFQQTKGSAGNKLDEHNFTEIQQSLATQIQQKLWQLKSFQSDDEQANNKLGNLLENSAQTLNCFDFYKLAKHFYLIAYKINPSSWCYPVYAGKVDLVTAEFFYRQGHDELCLASFESGAALYLEASQELAEDFTFNSYYGEFLLQFSATIYKDKNLSMLALAKEKFIVSKSKGNDHYLGPFIGLAKVALKLGDKNQCLSIIQQTKENFSTKYQQFSVKQFIDDSDFSVIVTELKAMDKNIE